MAEKMQAFSQYESLKNKVFNLARGFWNRKQRPIGFSPEEMDSHISILNDMGAKQTAGIPNDIALRAEFENFLTSEFNNLGIPTKGCALGWGDSLEAKGDRVRMAMLSNSKHAERFALEAIEAKRMLNAKLTSQGGPSYWSKEEMSETQKWLGKAFDRMAGKAAKTGSVAEGLGTLAKDIISLASDVQAVAIYADAEKKCANGQMTEEARDQAQKRAIELSKTILERPSLSDSAGRILTMGLVGLGLTGLAYMGSTGHLALLIPAIATQIKEWGGYAGTLATMIGFTVKATDFMGFSHPNTFTMDEWARNNKKDASKMGGPEAHMDYQLCSSYRNLGTSGLKEEDQERYLKALGAARAIMAGKPLPDTPEAQQVAAIPKTELPLLGRLSDPVLALHFLLEAKDSAERISAVTLQQKLNWAGLERIGFTLSEKEGKEASMKNRRAEKWLDQDTFKAYPREIVEMKAMSIKEELSGTVAGSMLNLCPSSQKSEMVSRLIRMDKNDITAKAILDTLTSLTDEQIRETEEAGFIQKHLGGTLEGWSKSLLKDPIRLAKGIMEWARGIVSNDAESFDYTKTATQLAKYSGDLPIAWDNDSGWSRKKDAAIERFNGETIFGMDGKGGMVERVLERAARSTNMIMIPKSLRS